MSITWNHIDTYSILVCVLSFFLVVVVVVVVIVVVVVVVFIVP
jgi:hypothetical protein